MTPSLGATYLAFASIHSILRPMYEAEYRSMTVHVYTMTILEGHLDTFGHVNNATYLELFEQARWDLIEANSLGLSWVRENHIGPVVLEAHIKYRKELNNREKISIETRFGHFENPLVMVLHQEITKAGGKTAAVMDIKFGLMDLKARKLIRPSTQWAQALGATSDQLSLK